MNTSRTAVLELTFAGSLWGFGFIASVWALREMGPLTIIGMRFALATVVGLVISWAIPSLRRDLNWASMRLALMPGLLLSITLVLQTWGLMYTTATKSGFITCLYVLIVPLMERLWLKKRLPRYHLLFAFIALIGVALICDLPSVLLRSTNPAAANAKLMWNFGDLLTFLCAIAASLQILWFAFISDRIRSAFVFNIWQSVWAGMIPFALALTVGRPPLWPSQTLPLVGLLTLAFGSTLIAFAFQVRAQKKLSPSLASLLYLLESPFATLFAIYFLDESLRTAQWVGAGLIMTAVLSSTIFGAEVSEMETVTES